MFLSAESTLTLLPGEEHDASKTSGATPSFCTLPLFHQPAANSTMANTINGELVSGSTITGESAKHYRARFRGWTYIPLQESLPNAARISRVSPFKTLRRPLICSYSSVSSLLISESFANFRLVCSHVPLQIWFYGLP